jgi:GNAT superfamily N-acetyltransferase
MERVAIRSAVPADVPRLVTLLEYGALEEGNEDPTALGAYVAALAEIQADRAGDVLVAEIDQVAVGMCQLVIFRHFQRRGGLCAELESMHVHPEFRRKGIGGQLLEAAVDVARQAGCSRIQLTSNLQRGDAHRFYERHEFDASHLGFKRLIEKG